MKALYHVEVELDGCANCGAGKRWTVIGPDDTAVGIMFYGEDRCDADELCEMLNGAAEEGRKVERLRASPSTGEARLDLEVNGLPPCVRESCVELDRLRSNLADVEHLRAQERNYDGL